MWCENTPWGVVLSGQSTSIIGFVSFIFDGFSAWFLINMVKTNMLYNVLTLLHVCYRNGSPARIFSL